MHIEKGPSGELVQGRAEPLMTPKSKTSAEEARTNPPVTAKLMAGIRRDVLSRLTPYDRRAQQHRGFTKRLAKKRFDCV